MFLTQVHVQDEGAGGALLDCIMGVSADTVVCVEAGTRQIVLVLPTNSLLGMNFYYSLLNIECNNYVI